jgi:hypothetical protein
LLLLCWHISALSITFSIENQRAAVVVVVLVVVAVDGSLTGLSRANPPLVPSAAVAAVAADGTLVSLLHHPLHRLHHLRC